MSFALEGVATFAWPTGVGLELFVAFPPTVIVRIAAEVKTAALTGGEHVLGVNGGVSLLKPHLPYTRAFGFEGMTYQRSKDLSAEYRHIELLTAFLEGWLLRSIVFAGAGIRLVR